ncbi:MAG: glycosyltransferase family 2 protein [Pseudomonadota bacterium]
MNARDSQDSICVVVVNYNGGAMIGRCLDALAEQSLQDFEVIVVDNGSSDGSLEALRARPERFAKASRFRLLEAGGNLGFARANNLAIGETKATWIATLNPDAYAAPDWLAEMLAGVRRHPHAVAFGATLLEAARPDRLDGAGDVFHASGLAWRGAHGYGVDRLPGEGEVFAPCAAAAFYRREAVQAIGGFDGRYFCYLEDVDLGFRLRLAGQSCVQLPKAVVRHESSGIAGRRSAFAVYHGQRNLLWTFVKDMPGPLLATLLPVHALAQLLLLARNLPRGTLGPAVRGLRDGLRGLPEIWRARRRVQRARRISWLALAPMLSWWSHAPFTRAPKIWRKT